VTKHTRTNQPQPHQKPKQVILITTPLHTRALVLSCGLFESTCGTGTCPVSVAKTLFVLVRNGKSLTGFQLEPIRPRTYNCAVLKTIMGAAAAKLFAPSQVSSWTRTLPVHAEQLRNCANAVSTYSTVVTATRWRGRQLLGELQGSQLLCTDSFKSGFGQLQS
jgi:hypothetical protein